MSVKSDQLKKVLQEMVSKEVRRLLPTAVKEVMVGMISEAHVPLNTTKNVIREQRTRFDDDVEVPTLSGRPFDRSRMHELYNGYTNNDSAPITVSSMNTEHGVRPVNPDEVPDHVLAAMNRDYSSMFKK